MFESLDDDVHTALKSRQIATPHKKQPITRVIAGSQNGMRRLTQNFTQMLARALLSQVVSARQRQMFTSSRFSGSALAFLRVNPA